MPVHPYLCSNSFKLYNWGAEIGFPNLPLLIQSGQLKQAIVPSALTRMKRMAIYLFAHSE